MQTLSELKAGKCQGAREVRLAENLSDFPRELFDLADSLELLDLSNNRLSRLPDDFDRFQRLKILFLSNNDFETVPAVLAACPQLEMIGFKSNRIQHVPENALPETTRWLILTDNRLTHLPESMGRLQRLQKCMLAGNRLSALPSSLANCHNLALLRVSANQLDALPDWLLNMPRLAWLAYAGNPFCAACSKTEAPQSFQQAALVRKQLLGEGASGHIYEAEDPEGQRVALKVFKGGITSDGYPQDERNASLMAGQHPNLVRVLGQLDAEMVSDDGAERAGLVMELIDPEYRNLGQPPSLQSCTRDTFSTGQRFETSEVRNIVRQIVDTLSHLHRQGLCHGDVYAHNILIHPKTHHVLFGDFGAASLMSGLSSAQVSALKRIELRALGALLEDLLSLVDVSTSDEWLALNDVAQTCLAAGECPLDLESLGQRLS